jgi:hypothetical protein
LQFAEKASFLAFCHETDTLPTLSYILQRRLRSLPPASGIPVSGILHPGIQRPASRDSDPHPQSKIRNPQSKGPPLEYLLVAQNPVISGILAEIWQNLTRFILSAIDLSGRTEEPDARQVMR